MDTCPRFGNLQHMLGRISLGAVLLLMACDGGDGASAGTEAWEPETEGSSTGASSGATVSTASTSSSPTEPPTTSDPDPTTLTTSGPGEDASSDGSTGGPASPAGCSPEALELVQLLNAYRAEHALPPIAASTSMCVVADAHVVDLFEQEPHTVGGCNLHSWSNAGAWSGCCYTSDHAAAQCMWDKPRELTDYPGNGYENAAWGGGGLGPFEALELWKSSSGHNAVMLNEGVWADITWNAVGAGFYNGYAVLWFGEETDPAP